MNLSQKKTCKNCRLTEVYGCADHLAVKASLGSENIPLEPCYKPLTAKDYFYYHNNIRNGFFERRKAVKEDSDK